MRDKSSYRLVTVLSDTVLSLAISAYHTFGSGCSGASVEVVAGSPEIEPACDAGDNGFVGEYESRVMLREGDSVRARRWAYPGGESDITYVADTVAWATRIGENYAHALDVLDMASATRWVSVAGQLREQIVNTGSWCADGGTAEQDPDGAVE